MFDVGLDVVMAKVGDAKESLSEANGNVMKNAFVGQRLAAGNTTPGTSAILVEGNSWSQSQCSFGGHFEEPQKSPCNV